ncbi:MAG: transcription antitermination factor NusB [Dethiosulfovibrio sp.]|nr:transcription antitermination factor NusB [Dethiosulfovibrio sp.]
MKKNPPHHKKHLAREISLQVLYSMDVKRNMDPSDPLENFDFQEEDVKEGVTSIVNGVVENLVSIDNMINRNVVGWRADRMVAVDRAAIRMAIYEGMISKTIPVAVAISEAVELAKVFGTEESGKFVNGVLAKVLRASSEAEETDGD